MVRPAHTGAPNLSGPTSTGAPRRPFRATRQQQPLPPSLALAALGISPPYRAKLQAPMPPLPPPSQVILRFCPHQRKGAPPGPPPVRLPPGPLPDARAQAGLPLRRCMPLRTQRLWCGRAWEVRGWARWWSGWQRAQRPPRCRAAARLPCPPPVRRTRCLSCAAARSRPPLWQHQRADPAAAALTCPPWDRELAAPAALSHTAVPLWPELRAPTGERHPPRPR